MLTAATALTGTHEHIDGYAALHMDPNAEGWQIAGLPKLQEDLLKTQIIL